MGISYNKIITIICIVLAISLLFSVDSCQYNKIENENNELKMDSYENENQKFKSEINKLGSELTSQREIVISKDKEIEKELLKNTNLKKLNQQIKIDFSTKLNNVKAEYESRVDNTITSIINDSLTGTSDTILLGMKFGTKIKEETQWYNIVGKIDTNSFSFDTLDFRNRMVISVGTRRKNIFSKEEVFVEAYNENPFARVNSMNNIKINREKEKLIHKPIVKFVAGVITGGFLYSRFWR